MGAAQNLPINSFAYTEFRYSVTVIAFQASKWTSTHAKLTKQSKISLMRACVAAAGLLQRALLAHNWATVAFIIGPVSITANSMHVIAALQTLVRTTVLEVTHVARISWWSSSTQSNILLQLLQTLAGRRYLSCHVTLDNRGVVRVGALIQSLQAYLTYCEFNVENWDVHAGLRSLSVVIEFFLACSHQFASRQIYWLFQLCNWNEKFANLTKKCRNTCV